MQQHLGRLSLNGAIANLRLIPYMNKTGKSAHHAALINILVMLMAIRKFIDSRKFQGTCTC